METRVEILKNEEAPASGADVAREDVEAELRTILASPVFRNAPRHSRFLRFVAHQPLAGEGEAIKEYLIGVEGGDSGPDYDPNSDPAVRAEARRLRSRLADYYREPGKLDPIRIELPKGRYVPVFQRNDGLPNEQSAEAGGEAVAGPRAPGKHRQIGAGLVLGAAVLALGAYGIHWFRAMHADSRPGIAPPARTLVLAEFTNTTGDALFDHILLEALRPQLEQSPYLNLLSEQRVGQVLTLMAQPKGARMSREVAREVCRRTGSAATIEGSISGGGAQYALALDAVDCRTGKPLAEERVMAAGRERVLHALGTAASQLRRKLGESLASVRKYDAPAENVTTVSLEALEAYSLGYWEMMGKGDYAAAVARFERAVNLDPNFAMGYARLGTCYENLDETEKASESLRKAYDLRDRVSEREKFYIDSHYYQVVTGDLVAARATYELWIQTYPGDDVPPINLGLTQAALGDYEKSLAAYQQGLKLDPGSGLLYQDLVFGYLSLNRVDEAKATGNEARARGLDSPGIHIYLYWAAFVQHDTAAMEREAAGLMGKAGTEDLVLFLESDTAA